MEVIGYFAAILMGLILGTIGGGGSILTVPILVYLMKVPPVIATGYSLLIVGTTAGFGAIKYYRKGLIDIKACLAFAIPSVFTVYLARLYVMPIIPGLITIKSFVISKNTAIMIFFALLMALSSYMMLRNKNVIAKNNRHHLGLILVEGAFVGFITGILGAGGGFLIIPALVLLMKMPMKEAVGSSLFIIALKSTIGFIGDLQNGIQLQIPLLPMVVLCTFTGMLLATKLSSNIGGKKLQNIFAYFTLTIASIIFLKELI